MRKEIAVFLCDRTGIMARPWAEAGIECYCVDIQHQARKPLFKDNIHYVYGDIRSWTPPERTKIVFVAGFPPCTHLAASGSTDWVKKGNFLLIDSLQLWQAAMNAGAWSGAPYCVENPVGLLSHYMRKPDYTFNPSDFAGYLPKNERDSEAFTKQTHLWAGNGFKMPTKRPISPVESVFPLKKRKSPILALSPSADRGDRRSETPKGFSIAVFEANKPKRLRT